MKKRDELTNPNSCFNKAKDDDYIFVLIQKDITMADTIRQWVRLRVEAGKNQYIDAKVDEALKLANLIDAIHGVKK